MFGFLFGKKKEPAGEAGSSELLVLERMVPLAQAAAFELFVDKLGTWWPREYTWAKGPSSGDRHRAAHGRPLL
jgi:hypothetical protein